MLNFGFDYVFTKNQPHFFHDETFGRASKLQLKTEDKQIDGSGEADDQNANRTQIA